MVVPNWVWVAIGIAAILAALYLIGVRFDVDAY